MGTVRQLTNASGAVTDTYDYDAFGSKINWTGSTPNNFLYRGEQFDSDLGLYYLRARYYNPQTGRFLSRDPEDGEPTDPKTFHKYAYVGGNPVNAIDPLGQEEEEYAGGISIALPKNTAGTLALAAALACATEWVGTTFTADVFNGLLYQNQGTITHGFCSSGLKPPRKKPPTCSLGGEIGAVVIGEDMEHRVRPYALSIGAGTYNAPEAPEYMWMANNLIWINEVINQGCTVFDAGPAPGRMNYPDPTSRYYAAELANLVARGYPVEPTPTPVPFIP